jgi:hypothetical protein
MAVPHQSQFPQQEKLAVALFTHGLLSAISSTGETGGCYVHPWIAKHHFLNRRN